MMHGTTNINVHSVFRDAVLIQSQTNFTDVCIYFGFLISIFNEKSSYLTAMLSHWIYTYYERVFLFPVARSPSPVLPTILWHVHNLQSVATKILRLCWNKIKIARRQTGVIFGMFQGSSVTKLYAK